MDLWKKLKRNFGTRNYLELTMFLVPLIFAKRRSSGPLLPPKGATSKEEAAQGLLYGDTALAPNIIDKWRGLAIRASQLYPNISVAWILAVIHAESRGNKNAVSSAGAEGLMQIMPGTQLRYGVSDPFDPWDNIEGGTHLLSVLAKRYGGDVFATMVAYNWGDGNYENALKKKLPPIKKSQIYAYRVIALYRLYRKLGV